MGEFRYFFSYARKDTEFVQKLATELRAVGVNLWLDKLGILGGQHWDRAIEEALETCEGMIVVLSPESVASNNVMDEVSYALEKGKLVVPIVHQPCNIPFRLLRIQRIDFTVSYDIGFSQLLRALHVEHPSYPPTPPTPDSPIPPILYYGCDDVSARAICIPNPPYHHNIELSNRNPLADFGRGFYTTSKLDLAKDWANERCRRIHYSPTSSKDVNAVVLEFNVNQDLLVDLDILTFTTENDYWELVEYCRTGRESNKLTGGYYDVVYGPVSLRPWRLTIPNSDQISFHTHRALLVLPTPVIVWLNSD